MKLSLSLISLLLLAGIRDYSARAFISKKFFILSSKSSPSTQIASTMQESTAIGEADRAFQQGIELEKLGQPRAANSAFHEAATLFQCYLDEDAFGHVTSMDKEDCLSLLSYNLVRLGFLNQDALSDPRAAINLYQMAISLDPIPSAVSYNGLGKSLEAAEGKENSLRHLEKAAQAYRSALQLSNSASTLFALGVVLERLGETEEADQIMTSLQRQEAPISCLVDSWGYVRWHTRKTLPEELNLHRGTRDMLKLALDAAMPLIEQQRISPNQGLICEFGVGSGRSLRMTQEILPLQMHMHGFDTFTGLPHAWGDEPKGAYSTGGVVPHMEGNIYFHKGLFGDTIVPFLESMGDSAFLAYANIDCDLYTSTLDILEAMHGRIIQGTILVFDEYICHPTWRQDEFRVRCFKEACVAVLFLNGRKKIVLIFYLSSICLLYRHGENVAKDLDGNMSKLLSWIGLYFRFANPLRVR
jgi:tetratricopeptide (TPR) repeat protein